MADQPDMLKKPQKLNTSGEHVTPVDTISIKHCGCHGDCSMHQHWKINLPEWCSCDRYAAKPVDTSQPDPMLAAAREYMGRTDPGSAPMAEILADFACEQVAAAVAAEREACAGLADGRRWPGVEVRIVLDMVAEAIRARGGGGT